MKIRTHRKASKSRKQKWEEKQLHTIKLFDCTQPEDQTVLINEETIICHLMNFAVLAEYKIKIIERENID